MKNIRDIIIQALSLENMPPEMQDDAVEEIGKNIFQIMIVHAMEKLNEKGQEMLLGYLDKDADIGAIFSFLEKNVPGIQEIAAQAITAYAMA